MASLILGTASAVIGGAFFGPLGASLGWALGAAVGNLFPNTPPVARLHDLHLQTSSMGTFLKIVYGKVRIAGNVIWETDLQEHISGGKGGKGQGGQASYTASFDVALTETKLASIKQIFAGGRLNYDFDQPGGAKVPFTFYDGNSTQLPDPTEEATEGAGNVPAYRGISRVVFTDWDMTQFGNTLPQLSFVVVASQGSIPWRVSTFNARSQDVSNPGNINATYDEVAGIITIGTYTSGGPGVTYSSSQFKLDGTVVSGPTTPTALDFLAGIAPSNVGGGVYNLQACYCNHDGSPATPNAGWFVGKTLVAPVDAGGSSGAVHPVYQNGFIYAVSGNATDAKLSRWVATDGIPTATTDVIYDLGANSSVSNLYISAADGNVWVTDSGVTSGSGHAIWSFSEDLTLLHIWTGADLPPLWKPEFSKFFYKGMVCVNGGSGGARVAAVYRINADYTFTLVGNIPQVESGVGTPEIQLTRGLVLGMDGVISLDPQDGIAYLSDVVADLCARAGLTSGQYNVTALSAIVVDGFVIESQTTCRAAIEMLMPVYFFDAVERDGVIVFVVRGGPSIVTFLDDDLAAHMDHDGLPSILSCVHITDADLPGILNIAYINKDADYQVNTQTWQRMTGGSRDTRTISVPIVLTDSHAKKIVDSWGYNAWSERDAYIWYSSRKYAQYEPTDVGTVQGKVLRITKKLEGATGVIKWEGVLSRGANFTQAGAGGAANDPGQTLPILQKSQLLMLDLPLLHDDDSSNGVYAAMAGALSPSYSGGTLFKSLDGTTYDRIATAARANTIGTATTVLANYTGPNVIDASSVVRVTIGKGGGTLTSSTLTGVLNGDNEGLLGFEIVQWMTATLISAGVYDLSNLLRGRRGTEWAQSSHTIGERFVAFDPAPLNPSALFAEIGATEYYKAVTVGQTLANANAQTFANVGNALKPYSPTYLGGGCDASGNVTLNWLRRTRIGGGGRLVGPKPLSEAIESYVVQIWDASYTLCARIIQVTTQTASYTAAMQVTDFGALQRDIFFTVGQIGAASIGAQARGTARSTGGSNIAPIVSVVPFSFNPVITPAPPLGGPAVDVVMTYPTFGVQPFAVLIGQRKVCQFTTGTITGGSSGHIDNFEYGTATTVRHCFIATDTGGLNKVAKSEGYGTTATSFIGAATGGAILSSSTTYYYIFDFVQADGTLSGIPGTNAASVLNMQITP